MVIGQESAVLKLPLAIDNWLNDQLYIPNRPTKNKINAA